MVDSIMYPPIFLSFPVDDKLVHVQVSELYNTAEHFVTVPFVMKGGKRDGLVYREGKEWIKGRIVNDINNLYFAQDIRTGTTMAVTQVSYCNRLVRHWKNLYLNNEQQII